MTQRTLILITVTNGTVGFSRSAGLRDSGPLGGFRTPSSVLNDPVVHKLTDRRRLQLVEIIKHGRQSFGLRGRVMCRDSR